MRNCESAANREGPMSGDSRRRGEKRTANPSKVHPIKPDHSPVDLPCDLDAERFVLGAVLQNDNLFDEIAYLIPGDFSIERHRRVLFSMRDLRDAGESIDRLTVC